MYSTPQGTPQKYFNAIYKRVLVIRSDVLLILLKTAQFKAEVEIGPVECIHTVRCIYRDPVSPTSKRLQPRPRELPRVPLSAGKRRSVAAPPP